MSRQTRIRSAHAADLAVATAFGVVASLWSTVVLASPEGAAEGGHGGEHGGGHIEWISPVFGNTGNLGLVWAILNFAVLFWLLEKILFSKLRARTREKHDTVKSEIDKATAARKEAESVLAEYKERLDKLDGQVESIMKDAKERAEADRARIVAAAEREAEEIKASARAAAEREAAARRRQIEAEVIDRAIEKAEALLRQKVTPADQRGMVDRYVDGLSSIEFGGRA